MPILILTLLYDTTPFVTKNKQTISNKYLSKMFLKKCFKR